MTESDSRELDWTEHPGESPHRASALQGRLARPMRGRALSSPHLARGGSLCKQ